MTSHLPESDDLHRDSVRRCLGEVVRDLRRSVARNRTIPLPTLLHLFSRRWYAYRLDTRLLPEDKARYAWAIERYYRRHQPFDRWRWSCRRLSSR